MVCRSGGPSRTREMGDGFALQDSISREIATRLLQTLTREEDALLSRKAQLSPEVAALLTRAKVLEERYSYRSRTRTTRKPLVSTGRPWRWHPTVRRPQLGLAYLYGDYLLLGRGVQDTDSGVAQLERYIREALHLDPTAPEALIAESHLYAIVRKDLRRAYAPLKKAVDAESQPRGCCPQHGLSATKHGPDSQSPSRTSTALAT